MIHHLYIQSMKSHQIMLPDETSTTFVQHHPMHPGKGWAAVRESSHQSFKGIQSEDCTLQGLQSIQKPSFSQTRMPSAASWNGKELSAHWRAQLKGAEWGCSVEFCMQTLVTQHVRTAVTSSSVTIVPIGGEVGWPARISNNHIYPFAVWS